MDALVGYIAGMLLFAATLLNLFLIPHPTWMLPVTCVLLPVTVWLAVRLAAPPGRGPTAAPVAA